MEGDNILIRLEDITFSYTKDRRVLDGIDFQLNRKGKVGLIGPNGSGKTTLFHIIMGLIVPDSGRIEIFGKEMKDEKDFKEVRRRIGLLFQDPDDQLFSPTVLEDVAFGPLNLGKSPSEAKEIALEILNFLGLEELQDRPPHRLSGGEKRLVSLATVLAMEPEVLLLDEPTNGLDLETQYRIKDILRELDISFIFISHDMDFISQTTQKVYAMVDGKMILDEGDIPHPHYHVHGYGRLPHTHTEHTYSPILKGVRRDGKDKDS
ncbi:MAG TPA: ABC transporter ATP-binding protein [Desulfobacteraceae bacterium]|nr:ABC transporter ATP-binding protein [Desulfobacteraceae bacterium]